MTRPTTTLHRFAWQAGSLTVGRGAAFVSLLLAARELDLSLYGRFVVLLALLEAAMIPWKPTVQQGAAARLGRDGGQRGWVAATGRWWVAGAVVLGPIAWWFDGPESAGLLVAASAASALMFLHVPGLLLEGRQRRIALGTMTAQCTRLAATVALIVSDSLTPRTALLAVGIGSVAGALAMWVPTANRDGGTGWLLPEVGTEGLRWIEFHVPVLVVALVLGLSEAGGFDLLLKLMQGVAEVLAGIGIVMLPAFLRAGERASAVLARSLRLPTLVGIGLAIAAGFLLGPFLEAATDNDLALGLAPALLGIALVVAPWMGLTKAALISLDASRWLLPSQVATSVVTAAASLLAVGGVVWAALAVGLAHLIGAAVRWIGLRSLGELPPAGVVLSPAGLRGDLGLLRSAIRRGG
jgi:O-antigen/teichoic acid export membrane protein